MLNFYSTNRSLSSTIPENIRIKNKFKNGVHFLFSNFVFLNNYMQMDMQNLWKMSS